MLPRGGCILLQNKKQKQPPHFRDNFVWPPPRKVVYRPRPIPTAVCRKVSGPPSSRQTVRPLLGQSPAESAGKQAQAQCSWGLPRPRPSDRTEPELHALLREQSICQTEQGLFFFFFNQNNATLLHYCPSAEHKDMGDFSVFLLQDLETKHPRVTSKICCQDTILASTLSLFKVDL